MLESIGSGVIELERISIGPIILGDLPRGSLRPLQPEEIRSLIAVAGADVR